MFQGQFVPNFSRPWAPVALLSLAVLGGIFLAAATAQQADQAEPVPVVTWADYGNGWLTVDQEHSESIVGIRRSAITAISRIDKGAIYSATVYREKYDLVVIGVGAREWRVRCPDEETANNLCKFLIGLDQ